MAKETWEQLQPLRIPGGWTVSHNHLENLEPTDRHIPQRAAKGRPYTKSSHITFK